MELKRGRLIDHIQLHASDVKASIAFYKAIFAALNIPANEGEDHIWADELVVDQGEPSHIHLAFQAVDNVMVQRFHAAGLAAGGRDNGGPGERHYHPGYYAAFLLDPDGNNIEAVYHGPAERSADAVTLTFEMPKAE